ncbi:IclR family transcriptional regulator [Prosthecodimorpha staleyi]|uniref:IclR family transcriptional regulator n=1 Tax=Prosthecodimorpha staleyi TaxID=2840188 RepID=A0A947GIK9_9HYPH|nr:IclR family transcriptional regulator [Prosthecodimorpha staleyi]MBT9289789.1 IclR family transcriptional regulator [Prosthecodimorpha staleyi]
MQKTAEEPKGPTSLQRGLRLLRVLAGAPPDGMRLSDLARLAGETEATAHRLARDLTAEGFVERTADRRYRVGLDFFSIAARAETADNLRDICRPALLRLSATLNDTIFLLVRSGLNVVCLDRADGPFPIRSFTGDIGGRIPLGMGQGSLVILAYLPPDEREEVIRFNLPRLIDRGPIDEAFLRTEIEKVLASGHAATDYGLLTGMIGVAVPIFDTTRRVVAALSVGTLTERLTAERRAKVVELLNREAEAIGRRLSPFDPALRHPARFLGGVRAPG